MRERILKVTSGSRNVLVICASVMFCIVVATALGIERLTNGSASALGIISILLGFYGTTLASIAGLIKGESTKQTAEQALTNTEKMLNGELQKKVSIAIKAEIPNIVKMITEHLGQQPTPPTT